MMTRSKIILVIVCALGLGSYCIWKSNLDTKQIDEEKVIERMKVKGTVVYALRDIEVGSLVTSDSVEQRPIEQCQIPGSAVCKASTVIGRKTVYGIGKGQILSNYDFLLPEQREEYMGTFELPAISPASESIEPTK